MNTLQLKREYEPPLDTRINDPDRTQRMLEQAYAPYTDAPVRGDLG